MNSTAVIRELINGSMIFFDATIAAILIRYIWEEVLRPAKYWHELVSIEGLRKRTLEEKMVIAFSVYHIGALIRASFIWMMLKADSAGYSEVARWIRSNDWLILLSLAIIALGACCAIRLFSRHPGTWKWVCLLALVIPPALFLVMLP